MDADRWVRIRTLFDEAATHPLAEREVFLRAEGGEDRSSLLQVESLLAADPTPSGTLRRTIGHGGTGAVFLGRRADQEYEVAVTVELVRGIQTEDHLSRFRALSRAGSRHGAP